VVGVEPRPLEEIFVAFARALEPRLRVALMARFGPEQGREAAAEAIRWAWEHWARVEAASNPGGYLYRVGARWAQRTRLKQAVTPWIDRHVEESLPLVEPELPAALARLSPSQRQAVVLVEGYGFTHAEVADLLGVQRSTVQTHVRRGLERLRSELGVHR